MNRRQLRNESRRGFLRLAGAGAALAASKAWAETAQPVDPLESLIESNQNGEFNQSYDSASRTIHMPKSSLPTLSASTVQTTEAAIARYEQLVADGGWPQISSDERLRLGMRNPAVAALRARLVASGDLDSSAVNSSASDVFDSYVEAAVRRFQARHGISIDGIVRGQTFKALNVATSVRLEQLKINVVRLRSFSGNLGGRHVVCNIPAAQIEAIEGGVAVSRHTAVVGKPDRPSPDIQSKIIEINFNPYWTVPVSIVRKDLIPRMQAEPDYLGKNHIRILDPRGNELQPAQINWFSEEAVNFRFKQDPGDFNSLGSIRINFPSPYGVYMHDTPLKNLFGEDFRFHSSGCVRVQNVRELVVWLLSGTHGWSRPEIDQVIKSGELKTARLANPVPLHWVYVTGWATADGIVQFREDIYGRDGLPGAQAARSEPLPISNPH
jgi:L,D-transpeptidase YcbB